MKQIICSLTMLLFIFSCKQDKPTVSTSAASSETNVVEDLVQEAKTGLAQLGETQEMYKGMVEHENNVLGGLKRGDRIENFTAKTHLGQNFELNKSLENGPVMFVFYRGHWCPKCTKHLAELEDNLLELKEHNISIYAVTPETEENIAKTVEKSSSSFPIIYDKDESIMKNFKVYYKVSDDYVGGLEEKHGQEEAFLPVPATYIVGKGGEILYSHYDHNYGNRAIPKEILAALD